MFMLALTAPWAALAHDGAHAGTHPAAAAVRTGQPWDFTLPALDGSRFVQASSLKGPVLVNFWGKDCGPCITELPMLEAFAKNNPNWTVLLISTDTPADAREFVQRHNVRLPVLRSGANVAALMRSAGNKSGALPFTVALHDAQVCEGQLGELDSKDLQRIEAVCAASVRP